MAGAQSHVAQTGEALFLSQGTLVVAAIGDIAVQDQWQCPGAYDCVVSVGAIDETDYLDGSAWGTANGVPRRDLVAPGFPVDFPYGTGTVPLYGTPSRRRWCRERRPLCSSVTLR